MVCVFSESYNRLYYAPWLSFPTCMTITSLIFLILLPFFTQFSNDNFWNPIDTYYEQPIVKNRDQYIIYGLNSEMKSFTISSISTMNKGDGTISNVGITPSDDNGDGIDDKITFTGTIQGVSKVTNLKILLFFDYILEANAKIQFQSMCYADIMNGNNIGDVTTKGSLILKQKKPLSITPFPNKNEAYDYFTEGSQINPTLDDIYKEFTITKPMTTKYDYVSYISPGTDEENAVINLSIEIDIPKFQEIIYHQPPYINLKFKWIQYLSIFIPTAIIIHYFLGFAFRNKIFNCSVMNNII